MAIEPELLDQLLAALDRMIGLCLKRSDSSVQHLTIHSYGVGPLEAFNRQCFIVGVDVIAFRKRDRTLLTMFVTC